MGKLSWYVLTSLRTFDEESYEHKPELFWVSIIVLLLGAIIFPLIGRMGKKKDKDEDEEKKDVK